MSEHDKYPHLGAGFKRGTDYQPAPAGHVEVEVPPALAPKYPRIEIEVPEGYLNPNQGTEHQALIAALERIQADKAQLIVALANLLEDCAPAANEGHIPAAPSERSFMAARAVLSSVVPKEDTP